MIAYLQSLGMAYGSCVNAHTNQDETVYKLSVPLPRSATSTNKHERLQTAIEVLHEWAAHMRISDEDVESERRVIEQEWRGKNGVTRRVLESYWEKVFGGDAGSDLIANRMPIGLPQVFMGCDPQLIRE